MTVKQEVIEEAIEKGFNDFICKYRKVVEEVFSSQFNTNRDALPLMNIDKFDLIYFVDDVDYFDPNFINVRVYGNELNEQELLIRRFNYSEFPDIDHIEANYSTIFEDQMTLKILGEPLNELVKLKMMVDEDRVTRFGLQMYTQEIEEKELKDLIRDQLYDYYRAQGRPAIENIAWIHKFKYTLYDVTDVLNRFTSNANIKTLLEQGIACYELRMYHAATATLGVAVEEICLTLLQENNIPVGDREFGIQVLNEKLIKNNIIDSKMSNRLASAKSIRNASSHGSTGQILKSDCDVLMGVIVELSKIQ